MVKQCKKKPFFIIMFVLSGIFNMDEATKRHEQLNVHTMPRPIMNICCLQHSNNKQHLGIPGGHNPKAFLPPGLQTLCVLTISSCLVLWNFLNFDLRNASNLSCTHVHMCSPPPAPHVNKHENATDLNCRITRYKVAKYLRPATANDLMTSAVNRFISEL